MLRPHPGARVIGKFRANLHPSVRLRERALGVHPTGHERVLLRSGSRRARDEKKITLAATRSNRQRAARHATLAGVIPLLLSAGPPSRARRRSRARSTWTGPAPRRRTRRTTSVPTRPVSFPIRRRPPSRQPPPGGNHRTPRPRPAAVAARDASEDVSARPSIRWTTRRRRTRRIRASLLRPTPSRVRRRLVGFSSSLLVAAHRRHLLALLLFVERRGRRRFFLVSSPRGCGVGVLDEFRKIGVESSHIRVDGGDGGVRVCHGGRRGRLQRRGGGVVIVRLTSACSAFFVAVFRLVASREASSASFSGTSGSSSRPRMPTSTSSPGGSSNAALSISRARLANRSTSISPSLASTGTRRGRTGASSSSTIADMAKSAVGVPDERWRCRRAEPPSAAWAPRTLVSWCLDEFAAVMHARNTVSARRATTPRPGARRMPRRDANTPPTPEMLQLGARGTEIPSRRGGTPRVVARLAGARRAMSPIRARTRALASASDANRARSRVARAPARQGMANPTGCRGSSRRADDGSRAQEHGLLFKGKSSV